MRTEIQPTRVKRRLRAGFGAFFHQVLKIPGDIGSLVQVLRSPDAEIVGKDGTVAAKGKAVLYGKGPDSAAIFTPEGTIVFPNQSNGDTVRLTSRK